MRLGHSGRCLVIMAHVFRDTHKGLQSTVSQMQMLGHRQGLALGHWLKMKWKNQNRVVIFFF